MNNIQELLQRNLVHLFRARRRYILPSTSISATSSTVTPASTTAPPVAVSSSINPALGRTPPSSPRALRQLQERQDTGGRGFAGDRDGFIARGPGTPYDPRDRDRF